MKKTIGNELLARYTLEKAMKEMGFLQCILLVNIEDQILADQLQRIFETTTNTHRIIWFVDSNLKYREWKIINPITNEEYFSKPY